MTWSTYSRIPHRVGSEVGIWVNRPGQLSSLLRRLNPPLDWVHFLPLQPLNAGVSSSGWLRFPRCRPLSDLGRFCSWIRCLVCDYVSQVSASPF